MGSVFSCAACAACNLAQCCACACCSWLTSMCCSCFGSSDQRSSGKKAKAVYLFLYLLTVVVAIIMRYYGSENIDLNFWKINCQPPSITPAPSPGSIWSPPDLLPEQKQYYFACSGNAVVYRLSMGTTVFFSCIFVACLVTNDAHADWWCLKIPLYLLCNIGVFFLPDLDYSAYAWISRVLSVLFLLLQIFILIEFGYNWNAAWLKKSEEAGGACCGGFTWHEWGLLGVCFACYALWFTGIVCLYHFVHCSLANFFTSVTLIGVVAFTVCQLFFTEDGALLPSAIVSGYCIWLCWSAIASDPSTCNTLSDRDSDNGGIIFVGIVFTALSLVWTSCSTAESVGSIMPPKDSAEVADAKLKPNQPIRGSTEMVSVGKKYKEGDVDDPVTTQPVVPPAAPSSDYDPDLESNDKEDRQRALDAADTEQYWIFHLVMVLGALYIAMLLTDWASAVGAEGGTRANPSAGRTGMWIKILSQWVTMALYTWTLVSAKVGPMCCPDREFG